MSEKHPLTDDERKAAEAAKRLRREIAQDLRAHIKALREAEKGHSGPWPQGYRAALIDMAHAVRAIERGEKPEID